jgi:citrate lyase subunit beta/citryl-CoA lyase
MVRRSRQFGFDGASCIHPGQVAIVNEEYGPRPEEVAHAVRVIEAADQAQAQGRASFQLDGKMIDIPVVERARRLLARQRRIEARAART